MTRTLAVVVALSALPGCFWFTTKHEGKKLRKDVDEVERRVTAQENAIGNKITKLEQVLEEATKLLQRNSADLGADVKSLSEDNAKLTGLVMEAKRMVGELRGEMQEMKEQYEARIADLEARLVKVEEKVNAPPPKSASEVYADAKRALDTNQYQTARVGFSTFVRKWPQDNMADDAMFYWGEAHRKDGNFQKAMAVYQKVFQDYADSSWADDALYWAGQSAEELKWCTDARAYYGVLQKKYPKSSLRKKAAARDKYLKKNRSKKAVCQT